MKRSGAIFTIFKKEMSRFLGDRRTLAALILPGILIYLVYSLLGNVMTDMFSTEEDYKPVISVINCPEELESAFSDILFDVRSSNSVNN